MKALADCRFYAFVDTAYLHGRTPAAVTEALCRGGADIIQLRAKGVPKSEVAQMARQVLPVTTAAGAWLVINDYADVAREVGAPACHLGQEDFFDGGFTHVDEIRKGDNLCVGLSTHAPAQAERALAAAPDYIAVGPVFPTATKPGARAVTLEYVRWAAEHVAIPWFAIGGITLENVADVLAAGARRICVVSAILNAPDIAAACNEFKDRIDSVASASATADY